MADNPSLMDNPAKAGLDDDLYDDGSSGYNFDPKFSDGVSEEDLIDTINQWVTESRTYHDLMMLKQNEMVEYYRGNQTDLADIPIFNSNSVYNRTFEAVETIVPIVTGSAHQFLAIPGVDSELSLERSKKLQKVLSRKYEVLEVQRHLENVTRDILLKRFGVLKWFWDITLDDVNVTTVDPRLILIPRLRMDANDLPYVLELQEYTYDEIKENFPDVEPDSLVRGRTEQVFNQTYVYSTADNNIFQVIECWTPEYVVWKQQDRILKRMPNPYFDFEGVNEEVKVTKPNGKVKAVTYKKFYNHLDRPQMPFVFLNPFVTGDSPVAEASLAEIAKPIQDDINTQKRQIINNLVKMGNGQVYVDSGAIPEERVDEITSEPGLVIQGDHLASENRMRRDPGVPLPNAHFSNLQESIVAFDNIFGIHGALRGAGGDKTLGGQILNKQQDLSRIDQLTRCLNRGVARLANGLVQMMKLFYSTEQLVKILGTDGAIEFVRFTRNDIDDGTVIVVKSGVPVSLDPQGKYNQAVQLWQLNALDPETLFERLDFADPQSAAKKLQAWKQGQLLFESQIKQAEMAAGATFKAKVDGAGAEAGAENRGVESPNNVIDRARKEINAGGAADLANPGNGEAGS